MLVTVDVLTDIITALDFFKRFPCYKDPFPGLFNSIFIPYFLRPEKIGA